jgi:outer membrane lipoprotein SlyB
MKLLQTIAATAVLMTAGSNAMARCHDVVTYRECRHHNHVGATVAGAVVGGVIGHQIGGGRGKDLATVGGAVAGGYAGHEIAEHHDRRCRRVERVCD